MIAGGVLLANRPAFPQGPQIAGAGRWETVVRGVEYAHVVRGDPRPLQIHVLRIDLREPGLLPVVDVAADPDGNGPAEAVLVAPLVHAERGGFVAAGNGHAWAMVPPPAEGRQPRYVAGADCDICGWVVIDGEQRSSPSAGFWSFWMDAERRVHIGSVAEPKAGAVWAIAGFGGLLHSGKVLPRPSDVRHPRTAAGIDRDGTVLMLVVVDGRQPGYSEGMSERELAELMLELGCSDALNLDGGGSTVMILGNAAVKQRIANRPSDVSGPRPIPVLFGVRLAPGADTGESRSGRSTQD